MAKLGKILVCAALAVVLCGVVSACGKSGAQGGSDAKPDPVAIGTLATEDILPMWVAESEGIFEELGLSDVEIVVFQSATELIAAVSSGEVDMAMTDIMVTASLYASGTDVGIKWVTLGATPEQGRFGIMTADPTITTLNDLAGVPIGVGSNTILEYVMDNLMLAAGVPQDQIVKEELQKLPVRYQAMASGQVAAAALPGSLLALGEASGCYVIADDSSGENLSQSVMIARDEYVDTPGGAAALDLVRQAWDQAVELINANPENYRGLLVEKANLPELVAGTYPISEYPLADLPQGEDVNKVLSWMESKGYLTTSLTYNAQDGSFSKN